MNTRGETLNELLFILAANWGCFKHSVQIQNQAIVRSESFVELFAVWEAKL